MAEEREFLLNYTVPLVQLDPLKTILVFSHIQNTFDKKKLLDNPNDLFRECDKTVDMFIKHPYENKIKSFFLKDIDKELDNYKHGDPIMKPDVLKQIKELEAERALMMKNHPGGQIMMQKPGEEPRPMTQQEILELIQKQQADVKTLSDKLNELTRLDHFVELDKRERKIQMLEGLVSRLTEDIKTMKEKEKEKGKDNITMQILNSSSKLVPEVSISAPIKVIV